MSPFLEYEKIHAAAFVTGNDAPLIGEHAAMSGRIAMERRNEQAGRQIPYFQRVVRRRGNRPLAVWRHRNATDISGVAFQRAQRAAGL